MIHATELRINNWVQLFGFSAKITHLGESTLGYKNNDVKTSATYEVLEPIPLSPSILEKAGFVKDNIDGRFYGNGFLPIYHIQGGCYGVVTMPVSMPHLKYLHQLQNLFFSLTGTELSISL